MTIAFAFLARNGIILAADGRALATDETGMVASHHTARKIVELEPGLALVAAGQAVGLMASITEAGAGVEEPETSEVASGRPKNKGANYWARYLSQTARCHYRIFSEQGQRLRPSLATLIAGYVPASNLANGYLPVLLSISSTTNFGVLPLSTPFGVIGSIGLVHYLLSRLYQPELSIENAAALAFYCLKEACFQNPLLGGELTLAYLRPDQPLHFLEPNELAELDKAASKFIKLQSRLVEVGLRNLSGGEGLADNSSIE